MDVHCVCGGGGGGDAGSSTVIREVGDVELG